VGLDIHYFKLMIVLRLQRDQNHRRYCAVPNMDSVQTHSYAESHHLASQPAFEPPTG
jgi:hypothetical protein